MQNMSRRNFLVNAGLGGAALASGGLLHIPEAHAVSTAAFNLKGNRSGGACGYGFDWIYQYQLGLGNDPIGSGGPSAFVKSGFRVQVHRDAFIYKRTGSAHIVVAPVVQYYNNAHCVSSTSQGIWHYGYGAIFGHKDAWGVDGLVRQEVWTGNATAFTCQDSPALCTGEYTSKKSGWSIDNDPSNTWYTLACEVSRVDSNTLAIVAWMSYLGQENVSWLSWGSANTSDSQLQNANVNKTVAIADKKFDYYGKFKWVTSCSYYGSVSCS